MPQTSLSAGAIGSFLGKQVASAIVTQGANQFVVPVLFDALGISTADEGAKYAEQVMAEMRRIGQELGRQIDQVKDSVDRVAALTLDIQVYQREEGLAQILRSFNTKATKIDTLFRMFNNDVQFLSVNDQAKNRQALRDLFTRLSSPNDRDVATAMKNIHDLVVPPTAGDKGILDYLADIVGQAVFKAAPAVMAPRQPTNKKDWRDAFSIPSDVDYFPANRIALQAHGAVDSELQVVRSVFLRILAAQTKGLMFLTRAWVGGPQESMLNDHVNDMLSEIAAMKGFLARAVPLIDAGIAKSIQQFGKSLTGEITRIPWLGMRTWHNSGHFKDVPEGLTPKWIVWEADVHDGAINSIVAVEEPWLAGKRRGLRVYVSGFRDERASFIDQQDYAFATPHYSSPAPAELTDMLKTLPATRKQLEDEAAAAAKSLH